MVQDNNETSMEMISTLQQYEEKATRDPLTGVFNHGEIESQLNNAIANCQQTNEPVSIMMLDLDHFKSVNDNYGHADGDTTLKCFAGILRDTAAEKKVLAGRWGGEEFVVVCRGMNGSEGLAIAEEIRKKIEIYEFPNIMHITCSVGVTEIKPGDDFQKAFDRMDKALYESKEGGRNKSTLL